MDVVELSPEATELDAYLTGCNDLLDALQHVDRIQATLAATRLRLMDLLRQVTADGLAGDREMALRGMRAELACALRIPERTVDRQWSQADCLLRELPDTFTALSEGAITLRHAQILIEETTGLEAEERADIERRALAAADRGTGAFARLVKRWCDRRAPERMTQRHRAAVSGRKISLSPERDGMAWLGGYLSAEDAVVAYALIDDEARAIIRDGDPRTLDQVRADLLTDLLLGRTTPDTGRTQRGKPTIVLTIPALTLLGRTDEPPELDGYGPIDIETAARLAGEATWFRRLLTHPQTGVPLSLDRTRYRPTEDLRLWLKLRDGSCRFRDCGCRTSVCDIDHPKDWAHHGQTADDNLAHVCEGHHTLKHATGWTVTTTPDGTLQWTSPLGRRYTTQPRWTETRQPNGTPPDPPPAE